MPNCISPKSPATRTQADDRRKNTRLVLAVQNPVLASELEVEFRRHGWDVVVSDGCAAGKLVPRKKAAALVMSVEHGCESGLLTAAKLAVGSPNTRVVLVGPEDEETERFALFAGAAAYLTAADGAEAIFFAACGDQLA